MYGKLYALGVSIAFLWMKVAECGDRKKLFQATTTTSFLQTFLEDYDNRIAPSFYATTDVSVSITIDSIDDVNEANMEFSTNIVLTQQWSDMRLRFFNLIESEYLELDTRMMTGVWVPDLYFANEKKAAFHTVTVPNKMMHIYRNGTVRYKARLSMTTSCPMKLQKYPLDRQVCSLKLRSFAYSKKNVVLQWHTPQAVWVKNTQLPQFQLQETNYYNCCGTIHNCSLVTDSDEFSCIQVDFVLDRELGYYLIQMYIPSVLIVALSWVSFWLSVEAVPARISLGILTVLTMTTQRSAATSSLPRVSYVKAIDVWMACCLVFVIAALLEYAFTNVRMRKGQTTVEVASNKDYQQISCKAIDEQTNCPAGEQSHVTGNSRCYNCVRQTSDYLDKLSRTLFPLTFVVFCIVYWFVYALLISDENIVGDNSSFLRIRE